MCGLSQALGVAGSLFNAAGSYQAGRDALKSAHENALLAEGAAAHVVRAGEDDVLAVRREARQVEGAARTAYGASGVDVQSGSAQRMLESTERLSEQDVDTIRRNAAYEAWGYKTQGQNIRKEGRRYADQMNLKMMGDLAGAGSFLVPQSTYSGHKNPTAPGRRGHNFKQPLGSRQAEFNSRKGR